RGEPRARAVGFRRPEKHHRAPAKVRAGEHQRFTPPGLVADDRDALDVVAVVHVEPEVAPVAARLPALEPHELDEEPDLPGAGETVGGLSRVGAFWAAPCRWTASRSRSISRPLIWMQYRLPPSWSMVAGTFSLWRSWSAARLRGRSRRSRPRPPHRSSPSPPVPARRRRCHVRSARAARPRGRSL